MDHTILWCIRDIPKRGKGLVATRKIPKGTRILCEEPLISIARDGISDSQLKSTLSQHVSSMSGEDRQAFLSMHSAHPYKTHAEHYTGIFDTNVLPAEDVGRVGIICLQACRLNHACDNNAQSNWNEAINRHTVHAVRDIEEEEEITISYLGALESREERQEYLNEAFGFTCTCRFCSLPSEESRQNDKMLAELRYLEGEVVDLGMVWHSLSPPRTLTYLDRQTRLYRELGKKDYGLANVFKIAARLSIANGDLARGRVFAEKGASLWKAILGDDSTQAIDEVAIARNPSKHKLYGMAMHWKTNICDLPQGMDESEFNDWLWRREKSRVPGQLTDLRNSTTFPVFASLPNECDFNTQYLESKGPWVFGPRRHWCSLGEIQGFQTSDRLQLDLMDADGRNMPLHFYTDGGGREVFSSPPQKGHTVAVLYAYSHYFIHSDIVGLRPEEPHLIKVFPVSLQNLLALSDRIQQYSTMHDGMRICHGCGKKAASLEKCARCSLFWYCDKVCQAVGWSERCHKADCKLLRDTDLRGVFTCDWDRFEDFFQFPLAAGK